MSLAIALSGAVAAAAFAVRRWPTLGLVGWLLALVCVPVWVEVSSIPIGPHPALALLTLLALFPWRVKHHLIDYLALGIAICVVLAAAATPTPLGYLLDPLAMWLPCYGLGRVLTVRLGAERVYRWAAAALTLAAALAVVEFVTKFDPFQLIVVHNDVYAVWGGTQLRGTVWRSEGAFGHSIALGASVALAVPLLLGSRVRLRWKLAALVVLLGGAVASGSRAGLVCSALGVLLTVVSRRASLRAAARVTLVAGLACAAAAFYPFIADALSSDGTNADVSADYRGTLLDLLPAIRPLGISQSFTISAGQPRWGDFGSIDDALILTGLRHGWLVLLLVVLGLLAATVMVLRLRATPATTAVVAQLPALVSVAFITQYSAFFWFVTGVAVSAEAASWSADRRRPPGSPTAIPTEQPTLMKETR